MWSGDDIYFMKLALEEAEKGGSPDEVPVGAALVSEGACWAVGTTAGEPNDSTADMRRSWRCAARGLGEQLPS